MLETIDEARQDVDADLAVAGRLNASRREEALRIVAHKLERLEFHTARSRRLLNDLRMLRRLLLEERSIEEQMKEAAGAD